MLVPYQQTTVEDTGT